MITAFLSLQLQRLEYNDQFLRLNGYNRVCRHKPIGQGGGVALFIKDDYKILYHPDLDVHLNDIYEFITVEVVFQTEKKIVVSSVYHPPSGDLDTFNEKFESLLGAISKKDYCILAGDYNINLLNNETHTETGQFLNNIYSLIVKANDELSKLSLWFRVNRLSLNVKKTNFILLRTKNKRMMENVKIHIEICIWNRYISSNYY